MSSKPAAIPLFADAYLADTMHLSTEEHGAYLLMLMAAWRYDDCSLPSDDKKLARVVGLSPRRWGQIKDTLLEFWTLDGDRIFHTARWSIPPERKTLRPIIKRQVLQRDGSQCSYCRTFDGPFEFDHILPWSRGGKDSVENLCVACISCNRAKSDRTPEEMGWLQ